MIITEYYTTREDGVVLNKTYSDKDYYIERDGVKYAEAIDPVTLNRTYTETGEPLPDSPDPTEATTSDLYNALAELGVE